MSDFVLRGGRFRSLFLAALVLCSTVAPAAGSSLVSDGPESITSSHAPQPDLTGVSAPGSVTIGESFEITIDASNDGGRAGHWSSISVSSPTLDESDDGSQLDIVSHDLDYETVAVEGDDVHTLAGTSESADYAVAEAGTNADTYWGAGDNHRMTVEFTPEETGTFVIYVRATMTAEDDVDEKFNDPASSSTSDQQRYPVKKVVVEVEPKYDAAITDYEQDAGTYQQGDEVSADVTVENTGGESHTFFVGYGVQGSNGDWYNNHDATGKTVSLSPGDSKTVTVEWEVQSDIPTGTYDARVAVWQESDRDALQTRLDERSQSDAFTVEPPPGNGEISSYEGITDGAEYQLDHWYDVTVMVKNTGDYEQTYIVEAATPSGTEVEDATKTVTVGPSETTSVTFRQQWYGTFTQTRGFSHDLSVKTDDGNQEVDSGSVTLTEPPNGEVEVRPDTADGKAADVDVTVRNHNSDEVVLEKTIANGSLGIDAKMFDLKAGQYELTASADGYRSRTVEFEITSDTQTRVEPRLVPNGVDAALVSDSLEVENEGYAVGEWVNATVTVENTGERLHEFFVGYSVRDESENVYSQSGQTGQFVALDPGETKTVEVSWRVDDSAATGSYDAIAAVWYGYPEDGAERIQDTGWNEDAFDVSTSTRTRDVTYEGTDYTVEFRNDGTIVVFDQQRDAVDAETARNVLRYMAFVRHSMPDADDGWWKTVEQGESLNTYYWAGHMTEAAIKAYKAYVKVHFGNKEDALGEFIALGEQASRLYVEQSSGPLAEHVHDYSEGTSTLYGLYSGGQDLQTYAQFAKTAHDLKENSEQADTMVDAIRLAEETDSGTLDPDLRQVAISGAFYPFNDVLGALKVTEQQSLVVVQWSKSNKPVLEMIDRLADKREQGTITPREMRLYYVLQASFYGSAARMSNQVATLQEEGEENSHAYDIITALRGGSPTKQMRQSQTEFRNLYGMTYEQMAQFESRADNLTARTANVHENPEGGPILETEPLSVTGPGWVEPGETATVHVESRGKAVVNAEVTIGDHVVETDRNGNATLTLYDEDAYRVSVEKSGFESAQTMVQVRDPRIVARTFADASVGTVAENDPVVAERTLRNTGEQTLELGDVSAAREGVEVQTNATTIAPGETLGVTVAIDPTEFELGSFSVDVTATWTAPSGETAFSVSGELVAENETTSTTATTTTGTTTDVTTTETNGTTTGTAAGTTETTTGTAGSQTATTSESSDETEQLIDGDTDVPGFGAGSALVALFAAAFVALRRR